MGKLATEKGVEPSSASKMAHHSCCLPLLPWANRARKMSSRGPPSLQRWKRRALGARPKRPSACCVNFSVAASGWCSNNKETIGACLEAQKRGS